MMTARASLPITLRSAREAAKHRRVLPPRVAHELHEDRHGDLTRVGGDELERGDGGESELVAGGDLAREDGHETMNDVLVDGADLAEARDGREPHTVVLDVEELEQERSRALGP